MTGTRVGLIAAAFALAAAPAAAQQYPNRTIRIVSPAPPGGSTDIMSRLLQPGLQEALKQTVVVENRGGAGGYIGSENVAKSPPDGHTLLLGGAFTTITATLQKSPGYIPRADLTPAAVLVSVPNILVAGPKLKPTSVAELVAAAKASPGNINYGSNGSGTTLHLSAELFQLQTGVSFTHVSYKGWADCMRAVTSGEVEFMFDNLSTALPGITEKKLRPFAVAALTRHRALPDVPTLEELGVKGAEVSSWFGILVHAKTPQPIIDLLGKTLRAIAQTPEFRKSVESQGLDVAFRDGAEATQFWLGEVDKWEKVIKAAKIAPQ